MSLIHPDNVNETLRILHAHQPMVAALSNLCKLRAAHQLQVPKDALEILNNEPTTAHPWPIEPQLEEPPTTRTSLTSHGDTT